MTSYVITGGRGIGLALAQNLTSDASNTVFVLVRNPPKAEKLQALAKERKNLHVFQADITDAPALKKAAKEVAAVTGGTLDILINNAAWMSEGVENMKTLSNFEGQEDVMVKDLNTSFNTNVVGVIHTINAFLPLLKAGTTKKVITISTGMASTDMVVKGKIALLAPYAISKAAVNMVNAKYAAEFGDDGFIFLALSPGLVHTHEGPIPPETLATFTKMMETFKKNVPNFEDLKEGGQTPDDAAKVLVEIISTLKPEENGLYMSHHRKTTWI